MTAVRHCFSNYTIGNYSIIPQLYRQTVHKCTVCLHLKGSVKEPNKFHNYETEKITRKASDTAEYIDLFGSSTRDRHVRI